MHAHPTISAEDALPHWLVSAVDATGWLIYASALTVLAGMGAAVVFGLAKAW